VNRWDGKVTTYTITPTTTFTEGSTSTTAASLVVGDRINIRLARRAPTTALKINIELAELAGKVTSVVGDLITITGPQGFARAIVVSGATTYTQGGDPATLADVMVGDSIFAQGTIDVNLTSLDALSVRIGSESHAILYHGWVTAVTSTSVTLDRLNHVTETFAITPTTTFHQGSTVLTAASLVVGDRVNVRVNSSDPTTALSVGIELAALTGRVTAVVGDSITITTGKGFSRAISVSSSTTYTMGGDPATLANVTVGSDIVAVGLIDANLTTLDATKVAIREVGHAVTYRGVITAVSSTSVTLNRNDGKTSTFTITPSTIITEGPASVTVPSLTVGDTVDVEVNSANPTTALRINVVQATLAGKVTAVVGNLITISGGQGFARMIQVGSSTTYTMGGDPATLANVTVDSDIVAVGTIDLNMTTLDATKVAIREVGHAVTYRGVITAVSSTSVTLNRNDGKTSTFTITPSTIITEGPASVTVPSLTVGDTVDVEVNSANPTTALRINVVQATLAGKVTAVVGNLITISGGQGFARMIQVGSSTTYTMGGDPATLANVTVGSDIVAVGTIDLNMTTLDATAVSIKTSGHAETIHGLVTAVATGSFTLNRLNGTTTTFSVTPSTAFTEGSTVLTFAALVVGDSADVRVNSSAPTTALSVNILLATLSGPVTAVSGNTITIRGGKGFDRTIVVSGATTYTQGGAPATLANVIVGSFITAQGTVDADLTTLDATTVTIRK
jgi:tartrate dehydratase beta subunit/fumarate hydratase class I family protein